MITGTELLNAKIRHNAGMEDLEFFAAEITAWIHSKERKDKLDGQRYYRGLHDILARDRTVIGRGGVQEKVAHLPNSHIVDNRFALMVDQKKNYLLGKPVTFGGLSKTIQKELGAVLGKRFMRTLKLAGEEAILGGVAWLYPYVDAQRGLVFRLFPSYEVCPFWKDDAHTELDCAARVYTVEKYAGKNKTSESRVELYSKEGVHTYLLESGQLKPLGEKQPYLTREDGGYKWDRLPLIPVKYNAKEIPLLQRVKSLQDALNLLVSDFVNNMEENVHNTVLVLKNYDGTDLGEFRKNLATYGAVKVRTHEGATGGVDTLRVEVGAENYRVVCEMLEKAIVQNARGYDAKDERMAGNPNQMNIQSMYSDIDLDANDMETELQAAFAEILWFVARYFGLTGREDFDENAVEVIFNRDILVNEGEAIENCGKSVGIISAETILGAHPWTKNPEEEKARLKAETQETDVYKGVFGSEQQGLLGTTHGDFTK